MIERTLAIIKPDAVRDKNSGKIIDRIEQEGFKIIAIKKLRLSREQAELFYQVHRERPFFSSLVHFMLEGPIIVMVLEKEDAIRSYRDLMGATDPTQAAPNTLRNLYGKSLEEGNAVHGSDGPDTAKQEIAFFFPELEVK